MKHLRHPATIVAALALFVALTGGAYASGLMSGSHLRNHSVAEKKLTRSAIRALRGHRGPAGPQGDTGPAGPAGTAAGYVHITPAGVVDTAGSLNVTAADFAHNGPGKYCFKGLGFTVHNVVATVDAAGTNPIPGSSAHVAIGTDTAAYCPANTQVAVVTSSGTALADYGVYVLFN